MNKTKLKNYAPQARRDFIQAMTDRAAYYGLTANKIEPVVERGDVAVMGGREFPRAVAQKRKALEERIQRDGFDQTMESLAYTWFNRLVAIRYMELHGYLDHGYRVLSPSPHRGEGRGEGATPEILQYAEHVELPGLKHEAVIDLKLAGNQEAELYRLLLVAQCNALNRVMPFLFERIDDETELLLPDNLLHSDSLIRTLVSTLDAEDCASVEVLGWLYQFYIAERKDQVMARKIAVPTEDIPAVTQLFTPHWIVRYLVENSLGRLWLLNRPGSRLREHMSYYIEGEPETDFLEITRPEDIRLCDPACGSGHMLIYAFDLLTLIYQEEGYAPTEIPALILRHNLYGLEICPRAAQLAGLALVFKAREKSRRFFQPEHLVRPHIIELQNITFAEDELADHFKAIGINPSSFLPLLHQFEEAKNFGSLIQPCLDEPAIANARRAIEAKDLGGQLFLRETHLKVLRVLEQAEALTQRYHVVVANPPYMGSGNFNTILRAGLEGRYKITRTDLYAIFMERSVDFVVPEGFLGMIAMQSWMFTSSYTELRETIVGKYRITSLVQLGARAFASIGGEVVSTAMFCIQSARPSSRQTTYVRLTDGDSVEKETSFHLATNRFHFSQPDFKRVPGSPMVYWVGLRLVELYEKLPPVGNLALFREGLHTADNVRFVRQWWEVQAGRFSHSETSYESIKASGARWIPYNKGGGCIRWYGNYEYVVAFDEDSRNAMDKLKGHIRPSQSIYFKEGGTWSDIGSKGFGVKYYPSGFLFDAKGPVCVGANIEMLIAGLNSAPFSYLAELLMPTISYKCGTVKTIPFPTEVDSAKVEATSNAAIKLARADWDNFETSWDFHDPPLLRPGLKGATLEASWRNWEAHCTAAIRRMQELETENNRLFIAAYGLDGELQPEVPEEQITLARADARRDMAALLSYAIGCMMGRYSLDQPGLIYAHSGNENFWPIYHEKHERHERDKDENFSCISCIPWSTYPPDNDGIIPVLDSEWFEDDIVARTREFLRAAFGEASLNNNLRFIEDSLGRELRKYFLTDFYKDHLQTYKKRPIYWLFSSGKQRAFQCLVYLHRYHQGTLARMRTEYTIPLQGRIAARIEQLEGDKAKATSTSFRKKLQKEQDDLRKQQAELATFEEKLKHYADLRISLDLDDGVKINYGKFGDLLAESKAITGGKDED